MVATAKHGQGGLEELDDAIKAKGGTATLAPFDDPMIYDAIDRLGSRALPAIRKTRRVWSANAGAARAADHAARRIIEPEGLGQDRHDGQPHRQLAADPLARPAAAPLGRRPGAVHDIERREQPPTVLGRLCHLQGGPRGAGADLCRRSRDDGDPRQPVRPRPPPDADARQGGTRRGSGQRSSIPASSHPTSSACSRPTSPTTARASNSRPAR